MTKLTFEPIFLSAFSAYTDEHNYLIHQSGLICREITGQALVIARTMEKSAAWFTKQLALDLPKPLQSISNDKMTCLWISPDECWLMLATADKTELLNSKTAGKVTLVDSSGAYGVLALSGVKGATLLKRLMRYDIETKLTSGKVISTTLQQAPVVLFKQSEEEPLWLLVRHSFANYVAALLVDAAKRI